MHLVLTQQATSTAMLNVKTKENILLADFHGFHFTYIVPVTTVFCNVIVLYLALTGQTLI